MDSIDWILKFTDDLDYEQFCKDRRTIDAVIRNITIIGEVSGNIPGDIVKITPEIPWKELKDIRNVVVHEYFGISMEILWDTI